MPRYTVVCNVFDKNGHETVNKLVPVDAADSASALVQAQTLLAGKYEQVYVKEVRAPEDNPVLKCKAAIKRDPDWSSPETMKALAAYFRATGQAWLCTPKELRA